MASPHGDDVLGASLSGPAAVPVGKKKSAALPVPQVRVLLQTVLPRKTLDAETVIGLIQYIQEQNYAAYCSHRRRTQRRLDGL